MELDFKHGTTQILDNKKLEAVKAYEDVLIFVGGKAEAGSEASWKWGKLPKCYIDNYKPKQGTIRNGLMIMPFEDAIAKYENDRICIGTRKSIFKKEEVRYYVNMINNTIMEYFTEVETTKEYNGYFCSVAEVIMIMILGRISGLKNVSQIHQLG